MDHRSCCVANCKNNGRNSMCKFYTFPVAPWKWVQRAKWIAAVKKINVEEPPWYPKRHDVVCSDHFIGGNKSDAQASPSYVPTIFSTIHQKKRRRQTKKTKCPPAPESLPKKPKEPRASTLELLSEIPSGAVIIARVYKYLQKEYEDLKSRSGDAPALSSLGDILGRTAAATGVSQRAVSAVLEADALKTYQGKRSAKPEVGKLKRPKYNSEDEDVSPIEEESDDDDGDSATQEEPCEQENGEDSLMETLKVEYYEDDDDDEDAQSNAGEQISRLQEIGASEVSTAIKNLIATTASRTQDGEVSKYATCSSADPLTDTPHAVKEEIPDDEYHMSETQVFTRTYSRHETPGKPSVEVKMEPIDEQSHTEPIDNATDDT